VLGADVALTGSAFSFTTGTTIDGGQALSFSGGAVVVDGSIGETTPLTLVTLSADIITPGSFNVGSLALSANANVTAADIEVGGTVDVGANNLTLTQTGTASSGNVLGIISGSGNITKAGAGNVLFVAANTYTGVTSVSAGELWISNSSGLGDSGAGSGTTVATGAALYLNGSLTVNEVLDLQGSLETGAAPVATWTGPITVSGGNSLIEVDSPGDTLVISGNITGTVGLTVTTDPGGTVVFSGDNAYTGVTSVSGGNLNFNGTSTGSDFTVTSGSNLRGSGSITGAVTVESGGGLRPGTSPGIISTGNLDLQSGSTLTAEIFGYATAGTDYDQLDVTGTVTLGGALSLVGVPAAATGGETVTLINNDGTDAVVGTFSNAPTNGGIVSFNGQDWRILYDGGDGNDVVLVFGNADLSIDDVTLAEGNSGDTVFTFTVTVDQAVGGAFAVDFVVNDDTATAADDFSPVPAGTLNFTGLTSGETKTVSVTVSGDTKVELNQVFQVVLSNLTGTQAANVSIGKSTGVGTITNDDAAVLTVGDVSVAEGNAGTATLSFTVSLDNPVDTDVTVTLDTADGTATVADN
ncbi:MAG: autotransporter-associated beta strand repeat-containing protein, partial [Planctomycetaceae bacterium]|nr:autotransporter-associated beta strand repeat-containing protein [Planctomycetaceae bacterium]